MAEKNKQLSLDDGEKDRVDFYSDYLDKRRKRRGKPHAL